MKEFPIKTDPNLLKSIWAIKRLKHISEKDFREMLREETYQGSTKFLLRKDAIKFINRLRKEKPRKPSGRPEHKQPWHASGTQKSMIKYYATEIGFSYKQLDTWLFNNYKYILRMLPNKLAVKAIQALKSMNQRGYRVGSKQKTPEKSEN